MSAEPRALRGTSQVNGLLILQPKLVHFRHHGRDVGGVPWSWGTETGHLPSGVVWGDAMALPTMKQGGRPARFEKKENVANLCSFL
jgi:hypothetical protein